MTAHHANRNLKLFYTGIVLLAFCLLFSGCQLISSGTSSSEASSDSAYSEVSGDPASEAASQEPESSEVVSEPAEPEPSSNEDPSIPEEPEDSSSSESLLPPADTENAAFNEKFSTNAIDAAYAEEIDVATSISEMVRICGEYTDLWSKEVDNAYMHLLAASDEEHYSDYKADQESWVSEKDGKIAEITAAAQEQGGSMALLNGSSQVMNFYRARAMYLYEELYQYDPEFSFAFQANG